MIDLACACWSLDSAAALQRLADEGGTVPEICLNPGVVAGYVEECVNYRRKMNRLWETARKRYPITQSPDIASIRAEHNLNLDVSVERWQDGPGRLIGCIDHRDVDDMFSATKNHVLVGGKWGETMVVPFYDLPDRIRAFWFIGRHGRVPQDVIFYRLRQAKGPANSNEAGLAGMPSIEIAGDPGYVIATDDVLLSLQVQMRTFRTSMRPMPLVVWRDDGKCRTRSAWTMLGSRKVVFWAMDLDYRVIIQAMETDGLISLAGPHSPTRESFMHYLRLRPGIALERMIVKEARPWAMTVRAWMLTSPQGEVSEMLTRLEQAGADVSRLLRTIGRGVTSPALVVRKVPFGSRDIIEKNDCWFSTFHRSPRLVEIINAVLRITHAIKDRTDGQTYYYGTIRHNGKTVPFIEKMEVVQDKTYSWLRNKLLEEEIGVLRVASFHRGLIHEIATLFHEPEFVVDDLYRWVEKLKAE